MPSTGTERVIGGMLAALAGMAIADLAHPNREGLLVLVLVPMASALVLRARATASMSALCILLALVLPGSLYEAGAIRFVRVGAVAGLSLLAIAAATWRQRLNAARDELVAQYAAAEQGRREALQVNDALLQEVVAARAWLGMGRMAEAGHALNRAVEASRGVVGGLLGHERSPRPGELVHREQAEGKETRSA